MAKYSSDASDQDSDLAGYKLTGTAGTGTFATVYIGSAGDQLVAIKHVVLNPTYKSREVEVLQGLSHPNIVKYFSHSVEGENLYIVMEYLPTTLYRINRQYIRQKTQMPLRSVKLYMYQLLRALSYCHAQGLCHRDVKPQNLLVDPSSHELKLCDFGSAKVLVPDQPNVAFIGARHYRAPELLFGSTEYGTAVDLWSAGCIAAELLAGRPLFSSDSDEEQVLDIVPLLGTPTRQQLHAMNPRFNDYKFPCLKVHSLKKCLVVEDSAISFIESLLKYAPSERLPAYEATLHPFFDELREPDADLPKALVPGVFEWTEAELLSGAPEALGPP